MDPTHVELLKGDASVRRRWRREHPSEHYDLTSANLSDAHLKGQYLDFANFREANLEGADLSSASCVAASFVGANLKNANLRGGAFVFADFSGANLTNAQFDEANLTGAKLSGSHLPGASFTEAIVNRVILPDNIENADFSAATPRYAGLRSRRRGSPVLRLVPYHSLVALIDTARHRTSNRVTLTPQIAKAAVRFYASLASRLVAFLSWPLVHKYGRLQILTKASYLALIGIPILAFLWPGVLRIVHAHDVAINSTISQANALARRVDEISRSTQVSAIQPSLESLVVEARGVASRLSQHIIGAPAFPKTFAALYFAAVLVAIGHLLYQVFADPLVKEYDRATYIRNSTTSLSDSDPELELRLTSALRTIELAAAAQPDEYHARLVTASQVVIHIPEAVDQFRGVPSYTRWAAIEAAAAIQYDTAAKRALLPALVSFLAYAGATILIVYVVFHQAEIVWHAANL